MTATPQAALLREAAQSALITLDGISNANPRDKADFETPSEWIAWAKSRARFAADALREPISREVYAERILKQMLREASEPQTEKKCGTCGFIGQEDPVKGCPKCGFDDMRDKLQATQAEPVQAGEFPDEREAFEAWASNQSWFLPHMTRRRDMAGSQRLGQYIDPDMLAGWSAWQARAALSARKPLTPTDEQVTAAAKALCDEFAADCNVDRDDAWKINGDDFKDSARRALIAANGIGLEVKP